MKKVISVLMAATIFLLTVSCSSTKKESQGSLVNTAINKYQSLSEISEQENILFLVTYMQHEYVTERCLGNHFMLYYITTYGKAYSAMWKAGASSPFSSDAFDNFTDIQELGEIDKSEILKYYNNFLCIDYSKLCLIQTHTEDIEYTYINTYGYIFNDDDTEKIEAIDKIGDTDYKNSDVNCNKVMGWIKNTQTYIQVEEIWQQKYDDVKTQND